MLARLGLAARTTQFRSLSLVSRTASTMAAAAPVPAAALDFLKFVEASPSPYHAVAETERRLNAAGFKKLSEREVWDTKPNGLYYTTRNQGAVVAFAVGGAYKPGNGFTIAAAHTDSPCLRVKPISSLKKAGYMSVGVETYGGGLWYSWLDRDLSIAGRAIVAKEDGVTFDSRLVRVGKPILRIPSLAIHLNREVNTTGLKLNAEDHLAPVLATAIKDQLNAPARDAAAAGKPAAADAPAAAAAGAGAGAAAAPAASCSLDRHHTSLVHVLAAALGVAPDAVHDFDLSLYDTQPPAIGGLHDEFIFSPRLDNLMMTYTTLTGLIRSTSAYLSAPSSATAAAAVGAAGAGGVGAPSAIPLAEDGNVRVMAAFDHEEVGSSTLPGAGSTLLEDVIRRLCPDTGLQPIALRKSILVSADMAHAVHPNYSGLHEENHRPAMHKGVVIKCNTNQRYATTSTTSFLARRMAEEAGIPTQLFVIRQDMGCGSTIGPIVATRLGIRTVDIGMPQLSMHSCREMCGTEDAAHAVNYLTYVYGRFPGLDATLEHAD